MRGVGRGGKGKGKGEPPPEEGEEKGDLLIRDLCTQGTDSIHDMRVVNTDAVSYQYQTPEKFLETAESKKKNNYLHACLDKRWNFTPIAASVDKLIGVDKEAALKHISSRLAQKWKEPYACTCGYMKSRVAITLVRATHLCIRGTEFRRPKLV